MLSENLEDVSILVEPSHTPAPSSLGHSTPLSTALSLPDSYYSPGSESKHSQSDMKEVQRSKRKEGKPIQPGTAQEANLIASDKELKALNEAYADGVKLFISSATSHGEPRSYHEATHPENPDSPSWIEAIQAELKSLQDHGTWKVVPQPEGKKVISCKWVWRIKTNPDGSIEHFKARLVARGFTQTRGVNFNKTFAPVTRLDTL